MLDHSSPCCVRKYCNVYVHDADDTNWALCGTCSSFIYFQSEMPHECKMHVFNWKWNLQVENVDSCLPNDKMKRPIQSMTYWASEPGIVFQHARKPSRKPGLQCSLPGPVITKHENKMSECTHQQVHQLYPKNYNYTKEMFQVHAIRCTCVEKLNVVNINSTCSLHAWTHYETHHPIPLICKTRNWSIERNYCAM